MFKPVACIIQSRIHSHRLPGKALMDIQGKPMLQHVIERALWIRGIQFVIVAVPVNDFLEYKPLMDALRHESRCFWYGGDEQNVRQRYADAANRWGVQHIMRVTGDCPLLCPFEAERVLGAYCHLYPSLRQEIVVTNDTATSGIPDGFDVEVFGAHWVGKIKEGFPPLQPGDAEHVTLYAKRHGIHRIMRAEWAMDQVKLSVDTLEDLQRVRAIVKQLPIVQESVPAITPYSMHLTLDAYQLVTQASLTSGRRM